jgi:outer membrane protein OmpA-like peptidoglycan-associated protein
MSPHTLLPNLDRAWLGSPLLGAAFVLVACAETQPSAQLVDARRAYQEAAASDAARLTPDELLTARQALDRAEAEHDDDPGSKHEKHLAYLATRKSEIAVALGKAASAKRSESESLKRYEQALQSSAQGNAQALEQTQQELDQARAAQNKAEQTAAVALRSLADIATVSQELRGMVITLPGRVLFPTGGSELSASARQSLERVSQVLSSHSSGMEIMIEGHTDSRGADSNNMQLSEARAQAVRQYLVERGVDSERLRAVGRGETAPIADNDTPDGRATNRRVEIVVPTSQQASAPGTQQQSDKSSAAAPSAQPTSTQGRAAIE